MTRSFAWTGGIALLVTAFRVSLASGAVSPLLEEVVAADERADRAISSISSVDALVASQAVWRASWLKGLGGLPSEKTPLNAKLGPVVACDGFTLQNVLFESQPGVYVVGHLALPSSSAFKPPYPCVLMPLGHSNTGVLNPRYAAHLAMAARAGLAAFAWDPLSQGERRQSSAKYDYTDNCSTEHARLGARSWLVGWNFARFHLWDAIRAVDYVCTRPEVDVGRLGVMGTSGGGTMSAYLQAWDDRISVAFPNCFVSSLRAVFADRGCHDAEQFYFGQLRDGVNHAAILAMGQPRVALAVGSRWKDYFPQKGAEATFSVFSGLTSRLGGARPTWHFSCDGPHGLPASTRAAQVDWMTFNLCGGASVRPLATYRSLDPSPTADVANDRPLPFAARETWFTPTGHVRDLPGFRSVYDLISERAAELRRLRSRKTRADLRAIVRRRAGIRPLAEIMRCPPPERDVPHTTFGWWYLKGPYGCLQENRAAVLATLGRSLVGEMAERMIARAAAEREANGGRPVVLRARGWDCIAAAHAFAAEPELFGSVALEDEPPSWTDLVRNPDPKDDSVAIGVWGALEDYDWPDLIPQGGALTRFRPQEVKAGGEIGRRMEAAADHILHHIDMDGVFLRPFREHRTGTYGGFVGVGMLLDAIVQAAAHGVGGQEMVSFKEHCLKEIAATKTADGRISMFPDKPGFWDNHEQAYLIQAFCRDYRVFGTAESLAAAESLASFLISTRQPMTLGTESAFVALWNATGRECYRAYLEDACRIRGDIADYERHLKVNGVGHVYTWLARALGQLEYGRKANCLPSVRGAADEAFCRLFSPMTSVSGTCTGCGGAETWGETWGDSQVGLGRWGETCASAYQLRLAGEMLTVSADARLGDLIERTLYNGFFAAQSPDGRHYRYWSPFNETAEWYPRDTYCCPNNFRRMVFELPDLIYFRTADNGVCVNLYVPSELTSDGISVRQRTNYPDDGKVIFDFSFSRPTRVWFRIPQWTGSLEGWRVVAFPAGESRHELAFALRPRLIRGVAAQRGRAALMVGPVVYGAPKGDRMSHWWEAGGFVAGQTYRLKDGTVDVELEERSIPGSSRERKTFRFVRFSDPNRSRSYFKAPPTTETEEDELFR